MSKVSQQNRQVEWIKEMFKPRKPKPEGWFTVNDVSEMTGENRKVVAEKLREMVKMGELEAMDCFDKGKLCKAYKKKS